MHVLSVLTLGSALFGAAATAAATTTPARTTEPGVAALLTPDNARVIPGRYIVKMREGAEVSVAAAAYDTLHSYTASGFKGFAAVLSAEELEAVRRDPDVSGCTLLLYLRNLRFVVAKHISPWERGILTGVIG